MNSGNNNLIKTDYVICPICKESAILEEKDYKLISYSNIYINIFKINIYLI